MSKSMKERLSTLIENNVGYDLEEGVSDGVKVSDMNDTDLLILIIEDLYQKLEKVEDHSHSISNY